MLVWAWLLGVGLLLCQQWREGGGATLQPENVWQSADRNCTSPSEDLCAMLNGFCQHGRCVSQNCTFQCVCHAGYRGRECSTAVVKKLDPIGDLDSLNHLEQLLQDTTSTPAPTAQAASVGSGTSADGRSVASTTPPSSPPLFVSSTIAPSSASPIDTSVTGGGGGGAGGGASSATSAAAEAGGGAVLTAAGSSGGASAAAALPEAPPSSLASDGAVVASPLLDSSLVVTTKTATSGLPSSLTGSTATLREPSSPLQSVGSFDGPMLSQETGTTQMSQDDSTTRVSTSTTPAAGAALLPSQLGQSGQPAYSPVSVLRNILRPRDGWSWYQPIPTDSIGVSNSASGLSPAQPTSLAESTPQVPASVPAGAIMGGAMSHTDEGTPVTVAAGAVSEVTRESAATPSFIASTEPGSGITAREPVSMETAAVGTLPSVAELVPSAVQQEPDPSTAAAVGEVTVSSPPLTQPVGGHADPSLSLLSALLTNTLGVSASPGPSVALQPLVGISPSRPQPQPSLPDLETPLQHQLSSSIPHQTPTAVVASSTDNPMPPPDQSSRRKDDVDDGGAATTVSSQQQAFQDWMSSGRDTSSEDSKERVNATDDSRENKTALATAPLTSLDDSSLVSSNFTGEDSKQDLSSDELKSTSAENSTETIPDRSKEEVRLDNSSRASTSRSDGLSRGPLDGGLKKNDDRSGGANQGFNLPPPGPSGGRDDSAVAFPAGALIPPSRDPFSSGGLSPLAPGLFPAVPPNPLMRNPNSAARVQFDRVPPVNLGLAELDAQLGELLRGGVHQPFPADTVASRLPGARSSSMRMLTKRLQDIKQPFYLTEHRGRLVPRRMFPGMSDRFAQTEDSGDGAVRPQKGETSPVSLTGTKAPPADAGLPRRTLAPASVMPAALSAARRPSRPQPPATGNASSLSTDNGGSERGSDNGQTVASSGSNSSSNGEPKSTRKRSSVSDPGLTPAKHRVGSSVLHSQASRVPRQGRYRDVSLATLLRQSAMSGGGTNRATSFSGDRHPVPR